MKNCALLPIAGQTGSALMRAIFIAKVARGPMPPSGSPETTRARVCQEVSR